MHGNPFPHMSAASLKRKLSALPAFPPEPLNGHKRGAALAIFSQSPQGPAILLTRRSTNLAEHAGQISFPGGGIEAGESELTAALRETDEEIGLKACELEILGRLPDQPVRHIWMLYSFAAFWNGAGALRINEREVERVIIKPLAELWGEHERGCHLRPDPQKACRYDLGEDILWGATARVVGRIVDYLAD